MRSSACFLMSIMAKAGQLKSECLEDLLAHPDAYAHWYLIFMAPWLMRRRKELHRGLLFFSISFSFDDSLLWDAHAFIDLK